MNNPSLLPGQQHQAGPDYPTRTPLTTDDGTQAEPSAVPGVNLPAADAPPRKNWVVAVQLSFLLGLLGVDRFYLGYTRLGILKLATLGGFGLWALVDLVLIMRGQISDAQGRPLMD